MCKNTKPSRVSFIIPVLLLLAQPLASPSAHAGFWSSFSKVCSNFLTRETLPQTTPANHETVDPLVEARNLLAERPGTRDALIAEFEALRSLSLPPPGLRAWERLALDIEVKNLRGVRILQAELKPGDVARELEFIQTHLDRVSELETREWLSAQLGRFQSAERITLGKYLDFAAQFVAGADLSLSPSARAAQITKFKLELRLQLQRYGRDAIPVAVVGPLTAGQFVPGARFAPLEMRVLDPGQLLFVDGLPMAAFRFFFHDLGHAERIAETNRGTSVETGVELNRAVALLAQRRPVTARLLELVIFEINHEEGLAVSGSTIYSYLMDLKQGRKRLATRTTLEVQVQAGDEMVTGRTHILRLLRWVKRRYPRVADHASDLNELLEARNQREAAIREDR